MADAPPFRYITDAREAVVALEGLRDAALIGLDTETYWDAKVSKSHVSLVQLGESGGTISVIDVLATGIEPVRAVVEEPAVRMVAHNARFDQGVLRGENLSPASFVDTLSLARSALVLPSHSLASVAEHLFGTPLDKSLQSSNWRRRPLTRAQLEYAAKDVHVTLMVYEELRRRLEAEGRWEDALRWALIPDESPASKPKRRRRPVAASPPLTPEEKRAVAHLKRWRLGRANNQRVPAYMICPDRTLECLARERPATVEALRSIYGLGDSKISNFGEELLSALREALT
ncbi:MAG TPA: HRDC domain-containing protein [Pyrinomonadaceae bacterium]|jgi:ribonuclease D|nr:HRDC domain-containing protein [Pyrinomonadaceae bacterium]